MREIKFRGKAKMSIEELNDMYFEHDNGWFYGNLVMYGDTPYIVGDFIEVDTEYTINEFWVAVHPESVGQYTGLKDKNGKDIYEQDILEVESFEGSKSVVRVVFDDGCFCYIGHLGDLRTYPLREFLFNGSRIQVIGNIFQDGDLLRDSYSPKSN